MTSKRLPAANEIT